MKKVTLDKGPLTTATIVRNILFVLFLLINAPLMAQDFVACRVDSLLKLNLPPDFTILDTLEQHILRARINNALIMVQVIENKGKDAVYVGSRSELVEVYTGFVRGMLETQGGEVLRRKEITLRGLLWYQFEYNAIANNEKQLRHFQVLLLKNKWYVVQFWELASMTKDLTTVRHEFFGSVGVKPGFTLEDQMNRRPPGFLFGKILGYMLITALFGVLIKWILRKKKKPQTDTLDSIV